jgi:hypothetical protein
VRDIFISYVEEDNHVTTQLAAGLEAAGYSVWYYERDGVPGASYLLQTRAAIEGCQAVILIISPDSVVSEQVTLEVVRAHESNKKFLPLRTNISHAEFTERRPEWAQALGASTSISVAPENISTVIPRLLVGLKKMNIEPRPELVTNEMGIITKDMIAEAGAKPTPAPPPSQAKVEIESVSAAKAAPRKKLYLIGAAVVALALAGAAIGLWLNGSDDEDDQTLTTTPVREEFLNLQAWNHPPNWAVGGGALEIAEAPQLGFLTDKRFRNFTMSFQVTLLNGEGAAWALRANDDGYYLFYLSGPNGMQPNRFVTYLAQGDKLDQVGTPFNIIRPLCEGCVYTISIKAEGNNFFHQIRIDSVPDQHTELKEFEGDTYKLGDYADAEDTFPDGSVGFRTFAGEKFSVADLFIYPPGTRPLQ